MATETPVGNLGPIDLGVVVQKERGALPLPLYLRDVFRSPRFLTRVKEANSQSQDLGFVVWGKRKSHLPWQKSFEGWEIGDLVLPQDLGGSITSSEDFKKGRPVWAIVVISSQPEDPEGIARDLNTFGRVIEQSVNFKQTALTTIQRGNNPKDLEFNVAKLKPAHAIRKNRQGEYMVVETLAETILTPDGFPGDWEKFFDIYNLTFQQPNP